MSGLSCQNVSFLPIQDQCTFVKDHCVGEGVLNSFIWYYCTSTNQNIRNWISIPILIMVLAIMFLCMGLVASESLVPNLNSVSRWCNIPQGLAGLTLMAFGNGGPDIVSTYASLISGNASLAISELIGAAFFINSVVMGLIFILHPFDIIEEHNNNSNDMNGDQMEHDLIEFNAKAMYVRDVIFFCVALIVLLYSLSDNVLNQREMLTMVGIYVVYVITIITWQWCIQSKLEKFRVNNRIRNMFNDENPLTIAIDDNVELEDSYNFNPLLFKTLELGTIIDCLNKERRLKLTLSNMPVLRDLPGDDIEITHLDIPIEIELPNPTITQKFIHYLTIPFITLFKYTIPILRHEEFDGNFKPGLERLTQMLFSMMISPFIIQHVFFPNLSWLSRTIIFIPILTSLYGAYYNLMRSSNPSKIIKLAISLQGFLTSICWMSLFASQVIDTLTFFSAITLLRTSLLGMTIFAIGNSMGDLISCIIISRMGYPLMALASCIGGPLLNLLLGFGLSGLLSGKNDISIPMTGSVTIGGLVLLFNLFVVFLILIPNLGWRVTKGVGWFLIIIWGITMLFIFLLETLLTY